MVPGYLLPSAQLRPADTAHRSKPFRTYRFTMTGPYYVEIGDEPRVSRASAQFFLDWIYQRARQIRLSDPEQPSRVIAAHRKARDFWQKLVDEANAE